MSARYEADYVVVGAGAMSMAFVDTILDETDADVVIVDRYDKPGGHWRVAYDHVRLHQPSDFYGVNSTNLGENRIDPHGYNEGLLELASGDELREYFERVMRDKFLPSGRVTYLPNTEYISDGNARRILSRDEVELVARKRFVDGTFMNLKADRLQLARTLRDHDRRCAPLVGGDTQQAVRQRWRRLPGT